MSHLKRIQKAKSKLHQFDYGGPFSVPVLRSSMAQRSEPRFAKPPERVKRGPPVRRLTRTDEPYPHLEMEIGTGSIKN
ncbi:hypothetical protein AHMF7605_06555 [Adhaeribacter arboris]|uniref:Uncharacterized protein n=1 Tax=Adhaeribacter arboris TaxID=2072846 RepID=A0A2T2YCI5_9BACT|nr:hypothetical protein AHMF7605_06555 [Adhaeribacter arboris]